MMSDAIQFLRRGVVVRHAIENPMQTVLDYLRLVEKSRGTKEGCNEGDCGACTVAIGRLRKGKVVYEAANACILLMGHLQGCELVTVDDLAHGETLHPVQQAMVDANASQCGFCTPGFVMSLFALHHSGVKPDRQMIVDQLAGNLCRCTGYRPIIAAAEASCTGEAKDAWATLADDISSQLAKLNDREDIFCGSDESFVAIPAEEETLLTLAAKHPDATLVAGATDVALWITKQLRTLPKIIHIGNVASLHTISDRTGSISIGGAATYAEAARALSGLSTDVAEVLRRIGSKQVRASGTIGGNIANGSPIGDMPPLLIALDARIALKKGAVQRSLEVEKFFIAYGKQDREPGEILWRIDVPKPASHERLFAHKISKRFDQDISSVLAAFRFTMSGRSVASARLAYGGMAATPRRALLTEEAIKGLKLDAPESWPRVVAMLAKDFSPISDMRATAQYRLDVAEALLAKALHELVGTETVRLVAPKGREAWT